MSIRSSVIDKSHFSFQKPIKSPSENKRTCGCSLHEEMFAAHINRRPTLLTATKFLQLFLQSSLSHVFRKLPVSVTRANSALLKTCPSVLSRSHKQCICKERLCPLQQTSLSQRLNWLLQYNRDGTSTKWEKYCSSKVVHLHTNKLNPKETLNAREYRIYQKLCLLVAFSAGYQNSQGLLHKLWLRKNSTAVPWLSLQSPSVKNVTPHHQTKCCHLLMHDISLVADLERTLKWDLNYSPLWR